MTDHSRAARAALTLLAVMLILPGHTPASPMDEAREAGGAHAARRGADADATTVRLADVRAIPYFARLYGVSCSQCHVSPPKLNEFGEAFVAAGYDSPGLEEAGRTWPLAVWASGRMESLPAADPLAGDVVSYVNRIELISGGRVLAPWLSYFVEWRALSLESRPDGTERDRSGRFEDLFVTAGGDAFDVTLGQFRMLQQVDVSRRIGLSEPLVYAASLPGDGDGSARERSLRAFSPAGRSPAVRAALKRPAMGGTWTTSVVLPVPGELSIPLTDEARTEASNEVMGELKGVFLESFVRRGLASAGVHAFYDDADRYLVSGLVTGARDAGHWGAALGLDRVADVTRGRWSAEAEYFPRTFLALGGRIEDRAGDGASAAFLPYVNIHFPGTRFTIRFTLEQRFQRDRGATLFELGALF
ncbi:MAG TPA: hypothetical protein VMM12_06945 [Longimicrobiales bacterium]|nr:hypothetical protein [Longimicrobiales bacterium]